MLYIAIIGDIKNSKKIDNRKNIQEKIQKTIKKINKKYCDEIVVDFSIVSGDEVQGLLSKSDNILKIINTLQECIYPNSFRFGVGVGEINTLIKRRGTETDGPAYYAARNAINKIREYEKKHKKYASDIRVEIYEDTSNISSEINTILSVKKYIETNWSEQERETILEVEENNTTQSNVAKRMNVSQSTIARRLHNSGYDLYMMVINLLNTLLKERVGDNNV